MGDQRELEQWSERSRTESSRFAWRNAFGGEVSCVLAKSSTAIDEGIEFRISGTRGQHHEIGFVANIVPVLLLAKGGSAMAPPRGGTNAGGAPS